jgi:dTDP-glucose 4,6-dehydratase
LVSHVINDYNVNYVIHFAAQSHVQNSFEDSLQYTKDNILGTHTLLEACRKYGKIQKFIHVSTDEVYGESMLPSHCNEDIDNISTKCTEEEEKKKTEESILCPTNPYAATKAGAELIAQSYYHSFKLPIIITRGNNVYGPNQYPEKLIPRFIKLLNENNKVTIQGDGSNIRAFLHVSDVVKAFEIILEKGKIGEIYNIGSDEEQEYTVLDVAKLLIKKIKNDNNYLQYITYIDDRPFNDKRYYISNEKIKELGWTITIDFENGLNSMTNNKVSNKIIKVVKDTTNYKVSRL